jgi:hypothetical protein
MSKLVKSLSLPNPLCLCLDHFPDGFVSLWVSIRILLFGYMELDHIKKYLEFDKLKNLTNLDPLDKIVVIAVSFLYVYLGFGPLKQGILKGEVSLYH